MLKFKIKQNQHVNKVKLNKTFSKKIKIVIDLNGIIVKDMLLLYYVGTVMKKLEIRR